MKWFLRLIILLLIGALVALPPILTGYFYLAQASSLPLSAQSSQYYESAAKLLFWQPELYQMAGLLETNDPARGIRLLTIARENDALTAAGQIALGDAYQSISQPARAQVEWEDLLTRGQEVPAASQRLREIYHASHNIEDEQRVLSAWLKVEPDNPLASEGLGKILAATVAPQALPLLETASTASPQSAARLKQLISALKNPTQQPAYRLTLCGQALAQLDEWLLAGKAFDLAVQTDPQYATAWAWLGLARQINGAPDALKALEHAQQLDSGSASLRAMLGTYWQQAGDHQKARSEFQKATEIEPGNPAWWLALGGSQAPDDLAAALKSYVQAVNLDPQNAESWYALAGFCIERNSFVEDYGLNAALRAYALQPKNALYMDMLGRAQMANGQDQAAEMMFKRALAAGSAQQTPGFHLHLGLLYLRTNREAQAKDELLLTQASDPQGQFGMQAKKLLERFFP
jgi:tetratricopeptide (TPR) repeat protein